MLNVSQSGWRVGKPWQLVGCRSWLIFRSAFSSSSHCCTWELLFVLSTSDLPSSQPTTRRKWTDWKWGAPRALVILIASETTSLLFRTSGHLSCCVSIYFCVHLSQCTVQKLHMVRRTACTVWKTLIKLKSPQKISTGTYVLAAVASLTLDLYLCFICNQSKAQSPCISTTKRARKGGKKCSWQGWCKPQKYSGKPQCPCDVSPFPFLGEYLGAWALLEIHRFGFKSFPGSLCIPYLAKTSKASCYQY